MCAAVPTTRTRCRPSAGEVRPSDGFGTASSSTSCFRQGTDIPLHLQPRIPEESLPEYGGLDLTDVKRRVIRISGLTGRFVRDDGGQTLRGRTGHPRPKPLRRGPCPDQRRSSDHRSARFLCSTGRWRAQGACCRRGWEAARAKPGTRRRHLSAVRRVAAGARSGDRSGDRSALGPHRLKQLRGADALDRLILCQTA